jgi:ATP-dependent Clp protease adaptor protein ClpS
MSSQAAHVVPHVEAAEALPHTQSRPQEKRRSKRQPPYAVVLHNDDFNSFEYVVGVLQKVFHYGRPKAHMLTLAAHLHGRSIVWSGMREVAELKADQIRSCGPDPEMKARGAGTLRVTIEPLPQSS